MTTALLIALLVLILTAIILLCVLLRREAPSNLTLDTLVQSIGQRQERLEQLTREETSRTREDAGVHARSLREELTRGLQVGIQSLLTVSTQAATQQSSKLDAFAVQLVRTNEVSQSNGKLLRDDLTQTIRDFTTAAMEHIRGGSTVQKERLEEFASRLALLHDGNEKKLEEMRSEARLAAQGVRTEITTALRSFEEAVVRRLEELRGVVDEKLKELREENGKKLDQMRQTVDEKLEGTLEKRLGESFKLVSDRLEQVHKGLGEMQTLASGVGDLKRVLSNVKARGTWAEFQLAALLEQTLAPDQFAKNVATKPDSNERVEFAIRLPGRDGSMEDPVWLPLDAKCPQEDYLRLMEAAERGDADGVREASKQLEQRVRGCAKDICDKYLAPPYSTDFGILFLPTEGLYAEVLRYPGLTEAIQRESRVIVAGPTTLSAILNSLQMGFRTLAIEKRSSEVWAVLGAVETEFGKFGTVFQKVKRKLSEATRTVEEAAVRTKAMERRLRTVDELPAPQAADILGLQIEQQPSDGPMPEHV